MDRPLITPEDLVLRPPDAADASGICEAVQASLSELMRWMPWAGQGYNEESAQQWINLALGEFNPFLITEPDGTIVGTCGLNQHDPVNQRANLGYWVRTDRTGRGYATWATRMVAKYGIDAGLGRIEIVMATENLASRRVAERAGAHCEGISRNRLMLHGQPHDAHMFSFIPNELEVAGLQGE